MDRLIALSRDLPLEQVALEGRTVIRGPLRRATRAGLPELLSRRAAVLTVAQIDATIASMTLGQHIEERAAEQEHAMLQLVEMTARYFWGNEL